MKKLLLFLFIVFCFACDDEIVINTNDNTQSTLSTDEYIETIAEIYLYGYPMVLMDLTKQVSTNAINPHPVRPRSPINQMAHFRTLPDHTLKTVVKPNLDTYYSICWFDLADGPQVLHMPASDRYYLLPFYDAFSNVYASPGTRTSGTDELNLFVVGPNWSGEVPEGYTLIQSPTQVTWMLGRIQVNSKQDGADVVGPIQDAMYVKPYSSISDPSYSPPEGKHSEEIARIIPVKDIENLSTEEYLNQLSNLLVVNPPLEQDSLIASKMQKIGFEPGKPFQLYTDNLILSQKLKLLPSIIHDRLRAITQNPPKGSLINNWRMVTDSIGAYGIDYRRRAFIAIMALGANLPEDAVYPVSNVDINGDPLIGSKTYTIHIPKKELPPVKAFWSLTAYTEDDFLIENKYNKFSLSSRDSLQYNSDGSLDLWIQNEKPAIGSSANWLPVTQDGEPFTLTMRLYWPEEKVLLGDWSPPSIIPVH